MRRLPLTGLGLALWACLVGCAETHAPPPAGGARDDGAAAGGRGLVLTDPDDVDPSGPCGEQRIPAVDDPPNLSFIVDRSASMSDLLPDTGLTKYESARVALSTVLRKVGHRVNYGLSVFPGVDGASGCEPGLELMPVSPGDDAEYASTGTNGPRLRDFLARLSRVGVSGGTPIAATLNEVLPTLTTLEGKTFAVLITDGAPNCNDDLQCTEAGCIPNIERLSYGGKNCTQGVNCCEPSETNPGANRSCIDDTASVQAVEALARAGIRTFVVGMPGSEPYEAALNAMAVAGGTAREGMPRYYSVADTAELEKSLKSIAASVSISCDLPLDYEPKDPSFVNVYFDNALVPYDADDGWVWTDDGHVSIRGNACEQLLRGDVLEVQVFAGCKTQVK
jgi:hypothetical protein